MIEHRPNWQRRGRLGARREGPRSEVHRRRLDGRCAMGVRPVRDPWNGSPCSSRRCPSCSSTRGRAPLSDSCRIRFGRGGAAGLARLLRDCCEIRFPFAQAARVARARHWNGTGTRAAPMFTPERSYQRNARERRFTPARARTRSARQPFIAGAASRSSSGLPCRCLPA